MKVLIEDSELKELLIDTIKFNAIRSDKGMHEALQEILDIWEVPTLEKAVDKIVDHNYLYFDLLSTPPSNIIQ